MDGWDDDDFEVPAIAKDDVEEAFAHPRTAAEPEPPPTGDDRPVLLLDLAGLAAQLGKGVGADAYPGVRTHVLATLEADFGRRSSELLASGLCWHTMASVAEEERQLREEARPGSFLTVLEYPDELDGVPLDELWWLIVRPTAWECLDEIKVHLAACNRGLKWKLDVSSELDTLADAEADLSERRTETTHALDELRTERESMLGAMQASHEVDRTPLTADDVSRMLSQIDELDARIVAAVAAREEAHAAGEREAAEGERSSVGLLLDLIFELYPVEAGTSWFEHGPRLRELKRELTRMWVATFGRLPAASEAALKHAPAPQEEARRGPPRLLVPPPPNVPRVHSPAAGTRADAHASGLRRLAEGGAAGTSAANGCSEGGDASCGGASSFGMGAAADAWSGAPKSGAASFF